MTDLKTFFSFEGCRSHYRRACTVKIKDDNKLVKTEGDGKTLSMKVNIRNTEKPIGYNQSFDAEDMNEKQRKNLQTHIPDSSGKKN